MSNAVGCAYCPASDKKRRKEGKIRCVRYSEWRDPFGDVCDQYDAVLYEDLLTRIIYEKE